MLRYKQPVAITYISLSYTRTRAAEHLRSDSPLESTTLPTRENSIVVLSSSLPTHHHHYAHPQHPYTHFKSVLHTLAAPHTGTVHAYCIHSTQTHTLNALHTDHIWTSLVVLVRLFGCFFYLFPLSVVCCQRITARVYLGRPALIMNLSVSILIQIISLEHFGLLSFVFAFIFVLFLSGA